MDRRDFLSAAALGATAAGLTQTARGATPAPRTASGARRPVLMKAGHQHDHSENTLRALAAFGVPAICSGDIGRKMERPRPLTVDLGKLANGLSAKWFNPATGAYTAAGGPFANSGSRTFTPPEGGGGDWVLLLER